MKNVRVTVDCKNCKRLEYCLSYLKKSNVGWLSVGYGKIFGITVKTPMKAGNQVESDIILMKV